MMEIKFMNAREGAGNRFFFRIMVHGIPLKSMPVYDTITEAHEEGVALVKRFNNLRDAIRVFIEQEGDEDFMDEAFKQRDLTFSKIRKLVYEE